MEDVADICNKKNHGQRSDNLASVLCNYRAKKTEDTDWGKLQDHFHTLQEDFIQVQKAFNNLDVPLFADHYDCKADKDCHDDDLKHVGVQERCEEVGWEDSHYGIHEGSAGFCTICKVSGCNHREKALGQGSYSKTDDDGNGCGAEIEHNCLETDGSHLLHISHGHDSTHDGEQYNWTDDELNKVQEDCSEGLDIGGSESCSLFSKNQADDYCKYQSDEYLDCQGHVPKLLFSHRFPP